MNRALKSSILITLKEIKIELKKYGVIKLGVFGSALRRNKNYNDVDIVIKFKKGKATFKNCANIIDIIEKKLKKPIDILTPDGINTIRIKDIKREIKNNIIYV